MLFVTEERQIWIYKDACKSESEIAQSETEIHNQIIRKIYSNKIKRSARKRILTRGWLTNISITN